MASDDSRERPASPQRPAWSFQIATIAGIPVRIHVTFLLLVFYFAYVGQKTPEGALPWVAFTLSLFTCVILHEFGHALTAKAFGIETRDITLYPIGGVAMFEGRMRPNQELWIALAGPAVNVVIALLLGITIFFTRGTLAPPGDDLMDAGLLYPVFIANVWLALFNLIPAFPMDGGRVLRALLGLATDEAKATAIAGTIGQIMAVILGFVGFLLPNYVLIFIAIFVYMGAGQEIAATATRSFLEGHRVREAMITAFETIASGETLQTAAEILLSGSQHDFPVMAGSEVVGILTRVDIARGLASDGPSAYVAGYMRRDLVYAAPDMPLEEALELFGVPDAPPILVTTGDNLVGMLTQENLSEFIMLQSALLSRHRA